MRQQRISAALGSQPADLVLQNARIVNVFTNEILEGDIAIQQGVIAGIGKYEHAAKLVDLEGAYVTPGLIDAHVHVESSMVIPSVYAAEAVHWGTTTLITDPHEIANVCGKNGIQFMLDVSAAAPVNYFVQIPSCVPTTAFEHAGAVLDADEMVPFLEQKRVLGLGEMMNVPGVLGCDPVVISKLDCFDGYLVDGHAPGLHGRELQAYAAAGVHTDHESTSYAEALEKLRAGLAVLVREGSACHNLEDILTGVLRDHPDTRRMAFCTDDKHLADIRREGTIRHCLRKAVALGMPAVQAIQMATINAAQIYGLPHLGAVAPGYVADLVVWEDLEQFRPRRVYKRGVRISSRIRENAGGLNLIGYEEIMKSVHFAPLNARSFLLPKREIQPVIRIEKGQVTTRRVEVPFDQVQGLITTGRLRKIAVIERHHATGCIGMGVIEGYGLTHGAVATTVAHDSHNIIVVGDNDADMLAAVHQLKEAHGGYTIVVNGEVRGTLPLPVAGLMSCMPADQLVPALDHMLTLAKEAGVARGIDPFITLSFMALPVIPALRITDNGLFNVNTFSFE